MLFGDALHGAGTSQATAWVTHALDVIWQEGCRCLAPLIGALSRYHGESDQDVRNRTWLFPHQC